MRWSARMLAYLEGRGYADIVSGERSISKPRRGEYPTNYNEFVKECKQARSIIVQALGDRPLPSVQSVVNVHDMWLELCEI